ncbi:hypothetical protein P3102_14860 [Amycolatopsis sp. QT-25]|uniref:hypothetical protein n=1 Tax=Amycolatopsis sp. QT-25 TaxID=3034022 RepID=UPI0023EB0A38|nr:hypothetical protein [Amycolatopsis sp. QT-25]WET82389.1 hypothetical protein P3102_14860 [Amycolatopsis sp. QT-25]
MPSSTASAGACESSRAKGEQELYFHGGAYVHRIRHDHWHFFGRLIGRTGCSVSLPSTSRSPD